MKQIAILMTLLVCTSCAWTWTADPVQEAFEADREKAQQAIEAGEEIRTLLIEHRPIPENLVTRFDEGMAACGAIVDRWPQDRARIIKAEGQRFEDENSAALFIGRHAVTAGKYAVAAFGVFLLIYFRKRLAQLVGWLVKFIA